MIYWFFFSSSPGIPPRFTHMFLVIRKGWSSFICKLGIFMNWHKTFMELSE